MAGSDSSSSGADQPPNKFEIKDIAINISIKVPRRKVTLITITFLLNVLLWSSLICLGTSIYQIASDSKDTTNIAPVALTSTSAIVTISYTFFHTIISLKQRIWTHQQRHPSAIIKTSYVGTRVVIALCTLWLLTCGWNMIIVARRPMCAREAPELEGWEFGTTCQLSRLGMAFAMIALIASCTLFGVLGAVRRPFEAHLFKHGYQQPVDYFATPSVSRRASPVRPVSYASEKPPRGRRRSASSRRTSIFSNTDVDTLDLNRSPPLPATILAPSPIRSIGLGIFTSSFTPPPIPPAYAAPPRTSSLDTPPPVFQPSVSHSSLPRQSRMSGLMATSGFVPLSIPAQYSASAWRAVHPNSPPPGLASRSSPHLPTVGFPYRNRYSRSSVSLTRPHRLSYATPAASVACSSRSGSVGPEGRESPMSGEDGADARVTASEIAYAIANGKPIPGTTFAKNSKSSHVRTASAPDATSGAQDSGALDRMAMGWKPELTGRTQSEIQTQEQDAPASSSDSQTVPVKIIKLVQSSSADFLSRFSPDTSPDDDSKRPRHELERELAARSSVAGLAARRSRSEELMGVYSSTAVNPAEAAATMLSRMPQDLRVQKNRVSSAGEPMTHIQRMTMTFEEVKNKPLPKIAVL